MMWPRAPAWTVPFLAAIVFLSSLAGPVSGQEPPSRGGPAAGSAMPPPSATDRAQGAQDQAACMYSISPENQSFPSGKGMGGISLTTTGSCSWTAESNAPWLKIDSQDRGAGSGVVKYSLSPNTSAASRGATITVAGRTFQVTQAGQASTPPSVQSAPAPQHTLTIERTGNGQGKVTTNPAGTVFRKGASVVLYAVPEANSAFAGWSGSCSGTSKTCMVHMTADRTATASFIFKTHTIHVRLPINGVIHPSGTVKANHGQKRRFQIIPLPGYRVSEVLVDRTSVGAVNSYTFNNVTGDHVLEVIFVKQ